MRFYDALLAAKHKMKQPDLVNGLEDDLVNFGIRGFHDKQLLLRKAANNLLHHGIGTAGNLLRCLVLNWMGHKNSFKSGTPQSAGLNTRGRNELVGGYRHGGNSKIFQANCIVQTARCARPSIGQAFYHCVETA